MKVCVIDYGVGNLGSVSNALTRMSESFVVSNKEEDIKNSKMLILPGVGHAGEGMKNLKKLNLDRSIIEEVNSGKPILGICLGMQLFFEKSEEGDVSCLGLLKGKVKKFRKEKKIPQIGWNQVSLLSSRDEVEGSYQGRNSLFKDIKNKSNFYYVNSYYCEPKDKSIIIGESKYGETFAGVIAKKNIFGTQFHPEKSGKDGFNLLKNFLEKGEQIC